MAIYRMRLVFRLDLVLSVPDFLQDTIFQESRLQVIQKELSMEQTVPFLPKPEHLKMYETAILEKYQNSSLYTLKNVTFLRYDFLEQIGGMEPERALTVTARALHLLLKESPSRTKEQLFELLKLTPEEQRELLLYLEAEKH